MPEEITPQNDPENTSETPETTAENAAEVTSETPESTPKVSETPEVTASEDTPVSETPTETEDAPENAVTEPVAEEAPVVEESPAEETPAEAPATETPAVEASATDEAADSPAGDEEADSGFELADAGTEIANTLLAEIMGSDEEFQATLKNSNAKELTLLMENIAVQPSVNGLIYQGGEIRKAFKALSEGEGSEEAEAHKSQFQTAFAKFNKKRKEYFEEQEKFKAENSAKKYALLEELKAIVEGEKVSAINEVREIQNKWKEIGWVLQKDIVQLGKTYKHYLDIFYTLRGHYNELRDRDRQYNLEDKTRLIEEIEEIIPDEVNIGRDKWDELTNRLKNLQEIWRTTGHVPRENADEIISRYRGALDRFYEARSSFYQAQDQKREENSVKKNELIEKLQPYATYSSDKAKEWNKATKEILAIQEEWKAIGPAPKEVNKDLWKKYREICDLFFAAKGEFFKGFDDIRQKNLDEKTEICIQAEALSDSTEWKSTADKLKQLQAQWKKIGPVQERHSNKIWKRFRKACDTFFEAKAKAMGQGGESQRDNLIKKKEILKKLDALLANDVITEVEANAFKDLQVSWKTIGHVPFKEKDKVNTAFREGANQFYNKLDETNSESRRIRMEVLLSGDSSGKGKGGNRGNNSRSQSPADILRRKIRDAESKISSYETNILYIAKGKKGDPLRNQIQSQIDAEKVAVEKMKAEIKQLKKAESDAKEKKKKAKEAPKAEKSADTSAVAADATSTEAPAKEEAAAPAEPAVSEKPAEEAPKAEAPAAETAPEPKAEEPAKEEAKGEEE